MTVVERLKCGYFLVKLCMCAISSKETSNEWVEEMCGYKGGWVMVKFYRAMVMGHG